uniref:GDSL esterase/lipase n=1 Tax=Kalanchoe fedtschenkoi TaxID=63787 RepID=A0A7N0VLK9_KALFE
MAIGISQNPGPALLRLMKPCCRVAEGSYTCIPNGKDVCIDRSHYLFFDNIHPTENVLKSVAPRYYSALKQSDAYPYDIKELTLR